MAEAAAAKTETTQTEATGKTTTETNSNPEAVAATKANEGKAKDTVLTGKETEAKTTEQKTVVPEKYDLKLPEGSTLSPAQVDKIAAFAKERGLSNEQAQGVLEREHAVLADYVTGQRAEVTKIQDSWLPAVKADKEIGGEAFEQNVTLAARVLDRYGTAELKKALSDSRYGNHPELVRVFARIGKAMSEDQLVQAGASASKEKLSLAERLYPNHKKEK